MICQLNPTIDVHTPLGDGEAFFIIDYGINVNSVWVIRFKGGIIKHLYSDDVQIYDNPMNGEDWDIKGFDKVNKIPAGAKRNMDFLKNNSIT